MLGMGFTTFLPMVNGDECSRVGARRTKARQVLLGALRDGANDEAQNGSYSKPISSTYAVNVVTFGDQ